MFFLKNASRYLALFFLAPLRNGVTRDLRRDLFARMIRLPLAWFSERRKGDVIARMTSDVTEVEWSIMNTIEAAFREPLLMIAFLLAMLGIHPGLTGFVLLLLPLTALIIGGIGRSLRRPSKQAQDMIGWIVSLLEESLGGLRIVKAFSAERAQRHRFESAVQDHYELQTRVLRRRDLSSPISEFLGVGVVAVVLWFGGRMVLDGAFSPEVFIGYILIFANLINPAKAFAKAYYHIQRGIASMERIEEVLDATDAIPERPDAKPIDTFRSEIEFDEVGFRYTAETPVLRDVNLRIEKGKMVALVGQSGAGKSTLVDLIPRFFDVTSGAIRIDGTDVRDLRLADLRGLLGIVTQESILFNDTVHGNIAFGSDAATRDEVIAAARVANAHDFIERLPEGYDTVIGDRGMKLSGGERQRLTIARAILKNPADPHPRRSDFQPRHRVGETRAGCPLQPDAQPHIDRDRTPALDHSVCRRDRRAPGWPRHPARQPHEPDGR